MTFFDQPASFADDTKKISAFMKQTLSPIGFKKRGNNFNRRLENGLIHQLSIFSVEAYSVDRGRFYLHAGCYIPEVELYRKSVVEPKWVPDYLCAIRGQFPRDYLSIRTVSENLNLFTPYLEEALQALACVDQYDHITGSTTMDRWSSSLKPLFFETPEALVKACILFARANKEEATKTLQHYLEALKAEEKPHVGHIEAVSEWAAEIGLLINIKP